MHSVLSILFGFTLAGLVYGLSLLPTARLNQPDDAEELVTRIDQESSKVLAPNAERLSRGFKGRARDDG